MGKNKVEIKEFLGMDVRVVNGTHIVLKDMFAALGRIKDDGTWTNEKKRLIYFLEDMDKITDHQLLVVTSKGKKKSREFQELECLKLDTVPITLTQFRPIKSNKRSNEENEEALNKWCKFMKFVDDLLVSLEVYKYIITDREHQKSQMEKIKDNGGNETVTNQQVNGIMAELIGVYEFGIKRISKDELKTYQEQTVVDLLEVREFVLEKFVNAYEFCASHKTAREMACNLAKRKYDIK